MKLKRKLAAYLRRNPGMALSTAQLSDIRSLVGRDLPDDYCMFMREHGPVSLTYDVCDFIYEYRDSDGLDCVETNSLAQIYDFEAIRLAHLQLRQFYHDGVLERMMIIGEVPNGDPLFMGFGDEAGIWFPIKHDTHGEWNPETGGRLIRIADDLSSLLQGTS